jgi:hypothetical protein
VILPTTTLGPNDFEVSAGVVVFRHNPFRWGGAEPIGGFPIRPSTWTAPAVYTSHRRTDWAVLGVRPGDTLQVQLQTATPVEATVAQVIGHKLALAFAPEGYAEGAGHRTLRARVYRTPFDANVAGERVPAPSRVNRTTGSLAGGSSVLTTPAVALGPTSYWSAPAAQWVDKYVMVVDASVPANNGFYRVLSGIDASNTVTLNRVEPFTASATVEVYLVDLGDYNGQAAPAFPLSRTYVTPGTFVVSAKRYAARVIDGVTYPADGDVLEGIDYAVDYDAGTVRLLFPWRPAVTASASYQWRLLIATESYTARGDWFSSSYSQGNLVRSGGAVFVCLVASSNSSGILPSEWEVFQPFSVDVEQPTREIAMWAVDARIDRDTLYNNFGYLLGFRKRSGRRTGLFFRA